MEDVRFTSVVPFFKMCPKLFKLCLQKLFCPIYLNSICYFVSLNLNHCHILESHFLSTGRSCSISCRIRVKRLVARVWSAGNWGRSQKSKKHSQFLSLSFLKFSPHLLVPRSTSGNQIKCLKGHKCLGSLFDGAL